MFILATSLLNSSDKVEPHLYDPPTLFQLKLYKEDYKRSFEDIDIYERKLRRWTNHHGQRQVKIIDFRLNQLQVHREIFPIKFLISLFKTTHV